LELVEPTGSTGSDRNPVGKIGEISYCLAYTVIQNFRSEFNQFQPVPIGTCGAQQRPPRFGNGQKKAADAAEAELSIFCPACPQIGINILDDWKNDLNRY